MQNSALHLWSTRLAQAGIFLLLVIGLPTCVLAPRALALFLPIAGGACLPLALLHARSAYAARPKNFGLWMIGLAAFLVIGAFRAPDYQAALNVIPGLLTNLASFISLVVASPLAIPRQQILRCSAFGFVVLVVMLSIEWLFGMPFNNLAASLEHRVTEPLYTLDRTVVIASLLIWPMAAYAKSIGIRRRILLPLILITGWLVFHTSSQAAAVGMAAGTLLYAASYWLPRFSFALLRPAVVTCVIGAPFLVLLAHAYLIGEQNFWPAANSGERLSIWISTISDILTRPWLGHGFDALRRIGTDGVPRLHPHNGMLQIWLETGATGILLASAALYSLLGTVRHLEIRLHPWMLAAFATWLVVFCVGYNIWQIWWQATTLLVIYLFLQLNRSEQPA